MSLLSLKGFITRSVCTVSAPFHPFGGAVDIVVVQQQDGSLKSSPWYVRFGKFQGVFDAKEKIVDINVNGDVTNLRMYLDHRGETYFLHEVDAKEGDSILSATSSGEEMDVQCLDRRPVKAKSWNYSCDQSDSAAQLQVSNGKVVARTGSRRSRILGLVFGRKSIKTNKVREEEDDAGVARADSLERAEIAANLLEVKWSTNLASGRKRNGNASHFSSSDVLDVEANNGLLIKNKQSQVDSSLKHDNIFQNVEDPPSHEKSDGGSISSAAAEMSRFKAEYVLGVSSSGDSGLEGSSVFEISKNNEGMDATSAYHDENELCVTSGIESPINSHIIDYAKLESCPSKECGLLDVHVPEVHVPEMEKGANGLHSFIPDTTSETSRVGLEDFGEQCNEALYFSCEVPVGPVHAETFPDLELTEVNSQPETLNGQGVLSDENYNKLFNDRSIYESEIESSKIVVTETYSEIVNAEHIDESSNRVESCSLLAISSFNDSISHVQEDKNIKKEDELNMPPPSFEPCNDSQEDTCDFVPARTISNSMSGGLKEEHFLFSDLDDFKFREVKCIEANSVDPVDREDSSLVSKGIEVGNESLHSNYESDSFPEKFVRGNLPNEIEECRENLKAKSSQIDVPGSIKVAGQEVGGMVASLPNMWSPFDELDQHYTHQSLGHSLDSNFKSSEWTFLMESVGTLIKSDAESELHLSDSQPTIEDTPNLQELENVATSAPVGNSSNVVQTSSGSWSIWPFAFKKSRSMKESQPDLNCMNSFDAENASESINVIEAGKELPKSKVNKKKKIRAITPTSEQLASLNLKEGRNIVTFTFSTAMLGKQQVDANIYLWRWDTRIVISDVDGTITKSDVLGQFMPLVGKDWSQTGVAHLFSAIKENGYQLLFLSARAISQAYHTRQFLFNLKQDGKALPYGPVVISPDGLFPSLFREVIRRAPHEFKVPCLEDIRACFPSDRNPFYAGFGNRHTDEFSYLKVGIPKGKIFIINPKGEVVVNRCDNKSYTSLHYLVNGMFPAMSSSEPEQEDFNSWNFWKLPPPHIDI